MKLKPRKRLRFRKIYRGPIIRITIDVGPMVRALQQLTRAITAAARQMAMNPVLLQALQQLKAIEAAR